MSDPTERFRVLRSLGRGGFGEVQLVYDTERQQQVALKRLHLDGAGSHAPLRREFRVLSALPHPNIVALHELHIDGDGAFFTMEPIEGVDAVSWVRWRAWSGSRRSSGCARRSSTRWMPCTARASSTAT